MKQSKVPFPEITTFTSYIHQYLAESIVYDITQELLEGGFFGNVDPDDVSFQDCWISPQMDFWQVNKYEFLGDLELSYEVAIKGEAENQKGVVYATLAFCIDEQITYCLKEITPIRPDRDLVRLDNYLIPIMGYDEVEEAAERIWRTYIPEALHDKRFINAYLLARKMNLSVTCLKLPETVKARSILYWKETDIEVIDDDGLPTTVTIPANTIVINAKIVSEDQRALSVFHECFHNEDHWLFYRLQDMYNNDLTTIKIKKRPLNQGRAPKNPLPIMEWEAKYGSRALMMPRSILIKELWDRVNEARQDDSHIGRVMEYVGREIAKDWGVPTYIVRSRMLHMGFWQAQGALNYIKKPDDTGRYIRPFVFKRDSCPTTAHTFVISAIAAHHLYETNEEYRKRIDSGRYVYVDGHICLNDPFYVTPTKNGPVMTTWANRHVDECCLRFENIYEIDEKYEFCLSSINSDEEYNRHYVDFITSGEELSREEINRRQSEFIASLPHKPGAALRDLMAYSGKMTNAALAEAALVSESTVKRWRNEEYTYDPEDALRIIVGLSLPPWLSYWFLEMAKVPLQYHGLHMLYRNIINCHYMDTIREVNDLIGQAGFKKFKDEA